MTFTNTEQITNAFIKDGWSPDTTFEELTLEEAKEKGYSFAVDGMSKGRKYFKMSASGNIFDEKGKLSFLNIKPN